MAVRETRLLVLFQASMRTELLSGVEASQGLLDRHTRGKWQLGVTVRLKSTRDWTWVC